MSLIAKNKKPAAQTSRAKPANLPNSGDTAPASTIIEGNVRETGAGSYCVRWAPDSNSISQRGRVPRRLAVTRAKEE